jgi:hypothetical protein
MHPAHKILEWLPALDFAVFQHGLVEHGRDYFIDIQDCLGADPGDHRIVFTHCVRVDYETRVRDDVWPRSWDDVFTNYQQWIEAGEPDGYVWGTNWSNAYPGLCVVEPSEIADEWTKKIKKNLFEITLETDRFFLRLVFHDLHRAKLSDSTSTISKDIIPLKK